MELADTVGPTAAYAENYLLAGTQAQRDFGVEDSVDKVRSEWSNFTVDGNSDDPLVQAFTRDLPAMESWFLSLGAIILGPRMDPDAGDTPRLHGVRIGELSPASLLALTLEEWVWTEHRAVDVVQEQGAVVACSLSMSEAVRQGGYGPARRSWLPVALPAIWRWFRPRGPSFRRWRCSLRATPCPRARVWSCWSRLGRGTEPGQHRYLRARLSGPPGWI